MATLAASFVAGCGEDLAGPSTKNCLNGGVLCEPDEFCTLEGTCAKRADAGFFDAGFFDAGTADAGGGFPDAGNDAGADAGTTDDAGPPDAGFPPDSGPPPDGGDGECETGTSQLCGSKVGVCTYGSQLCIDGNWGACVGGVRPSPEICDGLDNDCNGLVDDRTPPCECLDGMSQACGVSTVGECRMGNQVCVDGQWASCVGNVDPGTRQCDDRDRDCDGNPDYTQAPCVCRNGDTQACGTSTGICQMGLQTCANGQWGSCEGAVNPRTNNPDESAVSLCNGEDDNCDGRVDEGCGCVPPATQTCGSSTGECREGTSTCQSNGTFGPCAGNQGPQPTQCDDLDRDCNGLRDWDQPGSTCQCRNGSTEPCGTSEGICEPGVRMCTSGVWGPCMGGVGPRTTNMTDESADGFCNGEDDNCNGEIDEGCGCVPPATQDCGTDVGLCEKGTQECQMDGTWGACTGGVQPTGRICDGQDHDCDGTPDDQQPPCECTNDSTRSCGTNVGVCSTGLETCVNGLWGACQGNTPPTTTNSNEANANLCNGLDDNCNNQTDEGCGCVPPATQSCGTDVGECVSGTQSCRSDGTFGPCEGSVGPATRVCDGLDHDCDGTPDDQQPPCQCTNGATRSCGTNVGVCSPGTQTCVNGAWSTCTGGVQPSPELCDGLDNDCDGTRDNGLGAPTAVPCWTDSGGVLVCSDPNTSAVSPLDTVQLDGRMSTDPQGQALSYSWRIASAPAGSTVTISNPTSSRPTLFAQLAGDYVICLTVTDTTACVSNESCVTMHVVPSARIHIQLVWDKNETDMDLHFMLDSIDSFLDPVQCKFAKDCFWNCRSPDWGANGGTNNPRLDIDDVDGFGPENINLDDPFNGTFPIAVHYWCDRAGPQYTGDPQGASTATVRLFIDGVLINTWSKSLTTSERWYVADIEWQSGNFPPYNIRGRGQVQRIDSVGCQP